MSHVVLVEIRVHQFNYNMVAKTFFNSIFFSSIRKNLQKVAGVCITNHPKFNSKLFRLLKHALYKRTSTVTRKKLFVSSYIGVRKKCFLAIQHDPFPQFSDCRKALWCVWVALLSNWIYRKTSWNLFLAIVSLIIFLRCEFSQKL